MARGSKGLAFIEAAVERGGDACILWPFYRNPDGYGTINYRGRPWGAHRLALVLSTGQEPEGMVACHSCHDPSCVNPAHLRWGTAKENAEDRERQRRRKTPPPG